MLSAYCLPPTAYCSADSFSRIRLDHVPLREVVESVEDQATLHAGSDLAHVLAHAAQRRDLPFADGCALAQHAHRAATHQRAVEHNTPRRFVPPSREHRTHLGAGEHHVLVDRLEAALE